MKPSWEKTPSRLFLSIASIVFTLILMEFGLRYFRPVNYLRPPTRPPWHKLIHQPSSIPGLAYELAPNMEMVWHGVTVKTNSYGMRDHEPIRNKNDSLLRIVVLGDSYTFGWDAPAEETYPKVLEKRLNESTADRNQHFEVLNFGVSGYATWEEALVLKHKALAWDPEVVIIGYVLNDPETDVVDDLHAYFVKPRWWQYLNVFRLIARVKSNCDIKRIGDGDYTRYLHAQSRGKWMSVVGAFRDIKDIASRRAIKVLVVIFPKVQGKSWKGSWAGYPYKGIHKQVGDLAVKNGFQVIDLYEVYSHYEPRDVLLWPDEHPNRLGHELAARAIEEKLMAERSFFFNARKQEPKR